MTKSRCKNPRPVLSKGQLWKTDQAYIRIVELGKTLLHYRMSRSQTQKGVATQMSAIGTMVDYLKSNEARLITTAG
ncbi:MAG TPA: hypothetical protein VN829_13370 [Dongiaceae bacterium]|nr:hypothetical protein [Dongiaceae bacterium]